MDDETTENTVSTKQLTIAKEGNELYVVPVAADEDTKEAPTMVRAATRERYASRSLLQSFMQSSKEMLAALSVHSKASVRAPSPTDRMTNERLQRRQKSRASTRDVKV